jgi:hypothetical protein
VGEHTEVEESGSGVDRRTLIKRAAVAGAVAWTAPTIMQSVAGAQSTAPCSPFVTCTNFYSAKFNCNTCGACGCEGIGSNGGVDPSCNENPQPGQSYGNGCGRVSVTCPGSNWQFNLSAGCRFIAVQVKGGNDCSFVEPSNPCATSMTATPPSNLSHYTVYFCCNN